MQKYEWQSIYELSVPEIDGDHRTMLEIVNLIALSNQAGNRKEREKYISRLLEFSLLHFSREEQLLESWGYGEAGVHKQYHASMYQKALDNFRKLDTLSEDATIVRYYEEAFAYFIDDVIRGDMNIKSFLIERGIATPGNGAMSSS
ncbi:MAG: bacteriohemerythrin [Pseudomonadota bacterium]